VRSARGGLSSCHTDTPKDTVTLCIGLEKVLQGSGGLGEREGMGGRGGGVGWGGKGGLLTLKSAGEGWNRAWMALFLLQWHSQCYYDTLSAQPARGACESHQGGEGLR